ncbi:hypothetical protein RUND412_007051 [Rhizina undulata]
MQGGGATCILQGEKLVPTSNNNLYRPASASRASIVIIPTGAQRHHIVALVSLLACPRRPSPEGSHEPPRTGSRSFSQPSELHNVVAATATWLTPASKTMVKASEPGIEDMAKN